VSAHEAAMMELYIKWLNFGKVDIAVHSGNHEPVDTDRVYIKLVKAYILGFEVQDTVFQNVAVKMFHAALDTIPLLPGPESANLLSREYPAGSPLSRLIAHSIAYTICEDSGKDPGKIADLKVHIEEYDKGVLVAAMKVMVELRARPLHDERPYHVDISHYLMKEEP
jgi:hypothetical protein